ncbi:glycosyltransferase family 4 protein [Shewanella frigidimarina]|uniref:glycosyltransferase family 4 protein n=1 Tax=Shewanella frigidimarina TaxID=56812 RepID=UPI003D7A3CC4
MKPKLLCILHCSPPSHGAAKVGDFISSSQKLNKNFDCLFISIKSSDTIGDIGKFSLRKIYLLVELFIKVFWALVCFRPEKIYYTASIRSVAFYRDLLVSTLWKCYKLFFSVEIYYHYHTKGVNDFVSASTPNLILTRFFVRGVNLILLSPMLRNDFEKINSYNAIYYLPNGVEDPLGICEFNEIINNKFYSKNALNILFLSNMIKSKGYFRVLELAMMYKSQNINFHFAGEWQYNKDKIEFFNYISDNNLEDSVTFHGFVSGLQKKQLFKNAHFLVFPTTFEAFGLCIVEALSYGVPVLSTNEGSIPFILDNQCGVLINDKCDLPNALEQAMESLLDQKTAIYCRERYLEHFSLKQFENNLVDLLNGR